MLLLNFKRDFKKYMNLSCLNKTKQSIPWIISVFAVLYATVGYSQNQVCIGEDLTICEGDQVTIQTCQGQSVDTNVVFLGNINTVNLGDDQYSQAVNIGFNFQYYGNTYSQCLISSNGYITFNLGSAGGFSPWAINNAVPNLGTPLNSIMGPWHDYNPNLGGIIGYTTIGTAPNRQFVVVFKEVFMFGDPTEGCSGIVLHEGSNKIEVFLDEKPVVPTWNNGASIQATQNATGTIAHPVPGRNFPTQWSATLDGKAWVPNGPNDYIVSNIPYRAYVIGNTQIVWMNTLGAQLTPSGQNLIVSPTAPAGSNQIGYYINYSSCAVNDMLTSDTTWVTINNISLDTQSEDDFCSNAQGSATVIASDGIEPYDYLWNDPDSQETETAEGLAEGTYEVTVTDALNCTATTTVNIGDTPIDLIMSFTPSSCIDSEDGTASVVIDPAPSGATYSWNDPAEQTTSTAINLSPGIYTVTVETDEGCVNSADIEVEPLPEMVVGLINSEDVTCNSGNDGQASIEVTQGTAPYFYFWETSGETSASASQLVAGVNKVLITDDNGCQTQFDVELDEPNPLEISFLTSDLIICREDTALLTVQGVGGSSAYTYTWFNGGQLLGQGDTLLVSTESDSTLICVRLTEQCGSPIAEECMLITHPDFINPMLEADTLGTCIPAEINFNNITESDDVAFTIWKYGDGNIDTIPSLNPAFNSYENPGLYDVTMEVISSEGCRYSFTYEDLISAYPFPVGGMYFNPTPATIYDPVVTGFGQGTPDVISYEWFAPDAIPSYSNEMTPVFRYPAEEMNHDVMLVVSTANECRDTVTSVVRIIEGAQFFAPNAFSPDGDEFNQTWKLYVNGIDIFTFNVQIFNRWGEVVFESNNHDFQWDGTYKGRPVPEGTYIWKAQFKDAEFDVKYDRTGHVTIIR